VQVAEAVLQQPEVRPYVFIVAGVNKVGKDANPAMRSFVLR
jgi:hypothetical protein